MRRRKKANIQRRVAYRNKNIIQRQSLQETILDTNKTEIEEIMAENNRPNLVQLDEKILGDKYFNSKKLVEDKSSNSITYMLDTDKRDIKYDVVFNKLTDMYYIFAGANNNLSNASDKDLKLYDWETNDEDRLREFLRVEHLKNCMLSYNCIEDYMIQIVCFVYELTLTKKINGKVINKYYGEIRSKKDYSDKCEFINSQYVIKKIINIKPELEEIRIFIERYQSNSNIKEIKHLSNLIKHNCDLRVRELYKIPQGCNKNLEYVKPNILDLDRLIDMCYRANGEIRDFVNEFYNIIDGKINLSDVN